MFEDKKPWYGFKILGIIAATALLTGALTLFAIPKVVKNLQKPADPKNIYYNTNTPGTPKTLPGQTAVPVSDAGDSVVTQATNKVITSVVGISGLIPDKNKIFDSGGAGKWGIGSGVIVSPDGYIVTNNHVAGGKARITVTLENGQVVEGKTVWADPVLDLAIVKINGTNLPTAALGDNNKLKVGELAIAIGNPLGLQFQRTVTSGIVSGLNRTVSTDTPEGPNFMEDLIQTDAQINPGNSGGPLINSKGEVIGINSLKIQTAEGMGFAIPINIVKPIVNDFKTKGQHNSPHIGIFAYDKHVMNFMDNNVKLDKGIYVATVDSGGPANRGGIKVGDVITHVDNFEINTMMDLRTYIYNKGIGAPVTINYYSNGMPKTTTVTLDAMQKNDLTR